MYLSTSSRSFLPQETNNQENNAIRPLKPGVIDESKTSSTGSPEIPRRRDADSSIRKFVKGAANIKPKTALVIESDKAVIASTHLRDSYSPAHDTAALQYEGEGTAGRREVRSNWGAFDISNSLFGYFPTDKTFQPKNLDELTEAIQIAESKGRTIRAQGSGMSFSDVCLPQSNPISTEMAQQYWPLAAAGQFEEPNSMREALFSWADCFGFAIDTRSLNGSLQSSLHEILNDKQDAASFCFVEAGMTISAINEMLDKDSPRRALKTMGGAAAQTIAGAISTGTHGGDFDRPPLSDSVRAFYVVGAGGEHHWIEPEEYITDVKKIQQTFPRIKPDNIHYCDKMYRAMLVSMGGMGAIYGVILDVVPQYSLLQVNAWSTWKEIEKMLCGDFQPLLDGTVTGLKVYSDKYLRDEETPLSTRFLQVVINPIRNDDKNHQCFVTNRAELKLREPSGVPPVHMGEIFKKPGLLVKRIVGSKHCKGRAIFNFAASAARGVFKGKDTEVSKKMLSFCRQHNYPWVVREVTGLIMEKAFPLHDKKCAPYINDSWKVMAPPPPEDETYQPLGATSVELAFEFGPEVAKFIDAALKLIDAGVHGEDRVFPIGWLSLRVTGKSKALLGMQQHDMSAMVEVSLLGNKENFRIVERLQELARQHDGTFHWGQSNGKFDGADVIARYGQDTVDEWKVVQRKLGGSTFTNLSMKRLGLADEIPGETQ